MHLQRAYRSRGLPGEFMHFPQVGGHQAHVECAERAAADATLVGEVLAVVLKVGLDQVLDTISIACLHGK